MYCIFEGFEFPDLRYISKRISYLWTSVERGHVVRPRIRQLRVMVVVRRLPAHRTRVRPVTSSIATRDRNGRRFAVVFTTMRSFVRCCMSCAVGKLLVVHPECVPRGVHNAAVIDFNERPVATVGLVASASPPAANDEDDQCEENSPNDLK